ncbi:MAG TPA: flagellar hook-length control protein FliK [Nocardioides sp.]|nr:flagellar hook-length control protein FliK [Nocardioides sp.]
MTQLPALLPGMVPVPGKSGMPALPGSTPTPHDPTTSTDPFLALLSQLVGTPTAAPVPAQAAAKAGTPDDAGQEPEDADAPDSDAPATAVLPLPPLAAALVVTPPPATTPATTTPSTGAEAVASKVDAKLEAAVADVPTAPAPVTQPTVAAPAPGTTPATVSPAAAVATAAAVAPAAHAGAPAPAPAPVAHQVFPEVVRVAVSGETPKRVVIRLEPEHLGDVRVVLRTGRAGLEVSLAAGTEARAAIREGAPELRRMLEAAGSPDARIVVRHISDAPALSPTPAAAPVAAPSPVRTDAPLHGLSVDVGAGTAGGTAHGDRRDQPQQDARPTATDGLHDRPLETGLAARAASGLDVMM